jgi:hypothetical protein
LFFSNQSINQMNQLVSDGINDRHFVLAFAYFSLVIKLDGTHWNTERISWDGLAEIKVENNLVSGLAYNPMHDSDEWVEFKYDLDTKILIGGSYYSFENKKPWWKIW